MNIPLQRVERTVQIVVTKPLALALMPAAWSSSAWDERAFAACVRCSAASALRPTALSERSGNGQDHLDR